MGSCRRLTRQNWELDLKSQDYNNAIKITSCHLPGAPNSPLQHDVLASFLFSSRPFLRWRVTHRKGGRGRRGDRRCTTVTTPATTGPTVGESQQTARRGRRAAKVRACRLPWPVRNERGSSLMSLGDRRSPSLGTRQVQCQRRFYHAQPVPFVLLRCVYRGDSQKFA